MTETTSDVTIIGDEEWTVGEVVDWMHPATGRYCQRAIVNFRCRGGVMLAMLDNNFAFSCKDVEQTLVRKRNK